jgi:hypothetical protein
MGDKALRQKEEPKYHPDHRGCQNLTLLSDIRLVDISFTGFTRGDSANGVQHNIQILDIHADSLKEGLFFHPKHRTLFKGILGLWKEGLGVDIITLTERLEKEGNLYYFREDSSAGAAQKKMGRWLSRVWSPPDPKEEES